MKKKKGKDDFIRKHEYPGGKKAFEEFIRTNLVYPKEALEKRVQGIVFLEYETDFDGAVVKVKVMKGIGFGCDEEATRLAKLLKFSPQNNHGVKMSVKHKLKINFKLPEEKKTVIQYNLTSKKKDLTAENAKDVKKSGYTITVKLNH